MKTQNIVLALALAAVTPAVLSAQENGNAYNKSTNEVIASNTQQASIASFGPEGKVLSLADLTLAKIKQKREERRQRKQQEKQKPAQQAKKNDTTHAYYPCGGREGHMLVREDLRRERNNKAQKDTVPNHVRDIDTVSTNHKVNLDDKKTEKSVKKTDTTFQQDRRTFGQIIREEISNEAPYTK